MRVLPHLLAAALLSGCCVPMPQKSDTAKFPWKIPARAKFLAKIPPPPAPGSDVARRDLAEVLAFQAKATPAKIAQAKRSYDLTVFTYAPAVAAHVTYLRGNWLVGGSKITYMPAPNFNAEHYPQTAAFFKQLNDLVNYVNNYIKDAYKRPHPFQVSSKVQRFVIAKPGYSYPSYHSARCIVFQYVLDQLDPNSTQGFTEISHQVEEDRVFAGEHFPSDIAAGIKLGDLIRDALVKDRSFRAGIAALKKAEWTPPPGKVTWQK